MSDDQVDDDAGALFGLDELAADVGRVGPVEAGTRHALAAGGQSAVTAGLAAAALSTARRLDEADRLAKVAGLKAGYLYAQLVPPYRELMQALGLPPAVEPAAGTPVDSDAPATLAGGAPSWVHDALGTPQ